MTDVLDYTGVKREIVAMGGSVPSRIRGRKAVAHSKISITLPSDAAMEKCLAELAASDDRLAETPAAYDWTFVEAETKQGVEGGKVDFGVVWYDMGFFEEKKDIYLGKHHLRMFSGFGVGENDVEVDHFRKVS
ncbi:hypothetical protein AHiyo4_27250 [Arthrobacter sp. Hiyo4]|nr:hypothetical protein AHiyo4_27250 [Arthrobacter sp. Hiyo4]